jgi:diphthamide biosynthesis protein 4
MAHSKDYYGVLGLPAPHTGTSSHPSTAEVRRAYKLALLAAHPDKKTGTTQAHTVDEVKEAYNVLAETKSRAEYDNWLLRNPGVVGSANAHGRGVGAGLGMPAPSSDFVLGLELLDLSDFDVLDPGFRFSDAPSQGNEGDRVDEKGDGESQMEWTRACRCGADKGFRILEEELGDAEARGEKEVLVGCEGCSLWVRVGFEVEEG